MLGELEWCAAEQQYPVGGFVGSLDILSEQFGQSHEVIGGHRQSELPVDLEPSEAWASSGAPPDPGRDGERDFHGERRRNESPGSSSLPQALGVSRAIVVPLWGARLTDGIFQ